MEGHEDLGKFVAQIGEVGQMERSLGFKTGNDKVSPWGGVISRRLDTRGRMEW